MRIKLIEPSWYMHNGELAKQKKHFYPALSLPCLAALIPQKHDICLVYELFQDIDFDEPVDLVGLTSNTTSVYRAYEIADEFRRRNIPVVMGGIHVSAVPDEALEHADTVIIGEAEETWPAFINDFRSGRPENVYRMERYPSLEGLPFPRFDLVPRTFFIGYSRSVILRTPYLPIYPVQTARGCVHSCTYCANREFNGNSYRSRPVPEIIEEIKALRAASYLFIENNIFEIPERAEKLFSRLIPLEINWYSQATLESAKNPHLVRYAAESGCAGLGIGIESLSQESLRAMGKDINRVGDYEKYLKVFRESKINVTANMMFGFSKENMLVFKRSYDFLIKNRVPFTYWWPLTPYPGTSFYQEMRDQSRIENDKWWLFPPGEKGHNFKCSGFDGDEEEFSRNFYWYYKRFYSLANTMRRVFQSPRFAMLRTFFMRLILHWVLRRKRFIAHNLFYD
jgi:radical SAM superfamily enzyme YgiQ (UPF0313 family)